jgi:regulator-associated protein of mTOR
MSSTSTLSRPVISGAAQVNWSIDRSVLSALEPVSKQAFTLDNPFPTSYRTGSLDNIKERFKAFTPCTVMHNLRPFLGVGYGTEWVLRGSGVGKGDDTDSGSYSFLQRQARTVPSEAYN